MSLSDGRLEEIASSLGKSKVYGEITSALRELQSLRASRRPDMSDEAVQAARWLLDFLVPAGSHIGPVDEKALVVARALLSREAERDAVIEQCLRAIKLSGWKHVGDDAYSQGMDRGAQMQVVECVKALMALKAAGQPSADGGKEGK